MKIRSGKCVMWYNLYVTSVLYPPPYRLRISNTLVVRVKSFGRNLWPLTSGELDPGCYTIHHPYPAKLDKTGDPASQCKSTMQSTMQTNNANHDEDQSWSQSRFTIVLTNGSSTQTDEAVTRVSQRGTVAGVSKQRISEPDLSNFFLFFPFFSQKKGEGADVQRKWGAQSPPATLHSKCSALGA